MSKYKIIYHRYCQVYNEYYDFNSDKEAMEFVEAMDNNGGAYVTYLIKPNGEKIDLKKDYEEEVGLR